MSRLTTKQIWAMPIALTVISIFALVIGLLADGLVDIVAWVGLGVPIVVCVRHVGRAIAS